jgi:heme/copper-type cytochrome/quinol oxidase subunit 2
MVYSWRLSVCLAVHLAPNKSKKCRPIPIMPKGTKKLDLNPDCRLWLITFYLIVNWTVFGILIVFCDILRFRLRDEAGFNINLFPAILIVVFSPAISAVALIFLYIIGFFIYYPFAMLAKILRKRKTSPDVEQVDLPVLDDQRSGTDKSIEC